MIDIIQNIQYNMYMNHWSLHFIVKVCTIQYPVHIVPISLAEAPSAPLLVSANFLSVAAGDRCRVGGDWDDG